jgi:uncharacterized protein with PIN domain
MVLDTSAIIAILFNEPEAEKFEAKGNDFVKTDVTPCDVER